MRNTGKGALSLVRDQRRQDAGLGASFTSAPLQLQAYIGALLLAAIASVFAPTAPLPETGFMDAATLMAVLGAAAFHVESARWLDARFTHPLHPHRALAAWALASSLMLPMWCTALTVAATTAHARWRDRTMSGGPRWIVGGLELVLCGFAATQVAGAIAKVGGDAGDPHGALALAGITAGAAAFFVADTALAHIPPLLRVAGVRRWFRGRSFTRLALLREAVVLMGGMLLAAAWSDGPWSALFIVLGTSAMVHARLVLPLRARLATESRLTHENDRLVSLVDSLAARNLELDDLVKFKNDLMSMLGHEISNPLTSVLGYSQIAVASADEEGAPVTRAALETIERNARKVADVLSDIRELVASEQGGIIANPQNVVLKPHLKSAIDDRARTQRPRLACPGKVRVRVQPGHLDQILANLLSNAAKYGGGATEVVVIDDPAYSRITVTVADAGPGLSATAQTHLFERFWRDAATASNIPGSGIGLFISRELARANGGDLYYERSPSGGSYFVLALARVEADAAIAV